MILGNLDNTATYEQLSPLFKEAFEYLKKLDFNTLETGKVELVGKDLYVNITDTKLKTVEDAKMEVHNLYADIQLPVSVAETFGWIDRSRLKLERDAYNPEKDIQFFKETATSYITIQPRDFIIFFPEDGHAPCIGEGDIRKIVVKVKVRESLANMKSKFGL